MPLPLTGTVSLKTGVPLKVSVKVIVPVGLKPLARIALSVSLTGDVPSVMFLGLARVMRFGLASTGWMGGSVPKPPVLVCLGTPAPLLVIYATGLTAVGVAVGITTWNV